MKISTNPLSAKLRRRIIMAKRGIENINKKTCILGCAVFFVFFEKCSSIENYEAKNTGEN